MSWLTSFLKILASVIPYFVRRLEKKNSPNEQQLRKKEQVDKAINEENVDSINQQLDDGLRQLPITNKTKSNN